MRILTAITIAGILGVTTSAVAECGKETRTRVDSLVCEGKSATHELIVNKLCGTHSGVEQTVLEIVERTQDRKVQRKAIFEKRLEYTLHRNQDATEFALFERKGERKMRLAAKAVTDDARTTIAAVKLEIQPARGKACSSVVDVSKIWGTWGEPKKKQDPAGAGP